MEKHTHLSTLPAPLPGGVLRVAFDRFLKRRYLNSQLHTQIDIIYDLSADPVYLQTSIDCVTPSFPTTHSLPVLCQHSSFSQPHFPCDSTPSPTASSYIYSLIKVHFTPSLRLHPRLRLHPLHFNNHPPTPSSLSHNDTCLHAYIVVSTLTSFLRILLSSFTLQSPCTSAHP